MKIALPNDSQQGRGGGWSFRRNFIKGLGPHVLHEFVENWREADLCLVTSSTMIRKETWVEMRNAKKKIVLRVDNAPRNSRNRNTGSSYLKKFATEADGVIYQSEWSLNYLRPWLNPSKYTICYNGVDTDIFKPQGSRRDFGGKPTYLYSRFNRDETKRWETVWYRYQKIQRDNPEARLVIVGKFSPENLEYDFDFFQGERWDFLSVVDDDKEMAEIYRSCEFLFAPYYMDCYSNTYLEALACDCRLFEPDMSGGTPELISNGVIDLKEMVGNYLAFFQTL